MTLKISLSLPPETEAKLRDQAAIAGKDVPAFVSEVVEQKLAQVQQPEDKPYEQWAAEFEAWMREVASRASAYPPGFIVNDSRESIYDEPGK